MRRLVPATLALLVSSYSPAFAVCGVEQWSIPYWGVNAQTSMLVSSGESCEVNGSAGGTNVLNSIRVTSPPRNGTATIGQADSVWYQSNPGFKGPDSFAFTMTGTGPGGAGSSTVSVSVTVQ